MLIKDPKIVDIKSLYSEGLISLFFNYLSIDHSFGNERDIPLETNCSIV